TPTTGRCGWIYVFWRAHCALSLAEMAHNDRHTAGQDGRAQTPGCTITCLPLCACTCDRRRRNRGGAITTSYAPASRLRCGHTCTGARPARRSGDHASRVLRRGAEQPIIGTVIDAVGDAPEARYYRGVFMARR